MFAAILPLAIAVAQSPSPPRIESVRVPTIAHGQPDGQPAREVDEIEIRLTGGGTMLWEGSLRVAANQAASYQQTRNEAPPEQCPPQTPYDRTQRNHINISIHARSPGQSPNLYRIDLSWARPTVRDRCGEGGVRTVQVSQTVTLEPGQRVVVEGDAGVALALTRRR